MSITNVQMPGLLHAGGDDWDAAIARFIIDKHLQPAVNPSTILPGNPAPLPMLTGCLQPTAACAFSSCQCMNTPQDALTSFGAGHAPTELVELGI